MWCTVFMQRSERGMGFPGTGAARCGSWKPNKPRSSAKVISAHNHSAISPVPASFIMYLCVVCVCAYLRTTLGSWFSPSVVSSGIIGSGSQACMASPFYLRCLFSNKLSFLSTCHPDETAAMHLCD